MGVWAHLKTRWSRRAETPPQWQAGTVGTPSPVLLATREHLSLLPGKISQFRPDIVGDLLASKLCPVVMDDGRWVLLVTSEYLTSDVVRVTQEQCARANKGQVPDLFAITPTLLLTLREGGANTRHKKGNETRTVYKDAFEEIIAWGVRSNASDVHLNVNARETLSQVCYSIDGQYVAPARWSIPTSRLQEILDVAWQDTTGGSASTFEAESEQQSRIEVTIDNQRIMGRWASMATDRGPSVCLRLLKVDQAVVTRSLEEQGFLPTQIAMFNRAQTSEGGAIVLAGVVGSGKSTTIASLLSRLAPTRKVITLEDPVEYRIPNALQNTISRSLEGNDDDAFTAKLKTIKRSAPHDLLLGEIRDRVSGQAFIDMAGSGTNLYTTVHAKSHFQIPERLASSAIGIPPSLLASPGILNLLVFQALIPVLCPHCALPIGTLTEYGGADTRGEMRSTDAWRRYLQRVERLYHIDPYKLRIRNTDGCEHCRHAEIPELNGYIGRTVVAEMLEPNADRTILNHIRDGNTLALQEHLEQVERTAIEDPDMTNKSILECALFKALQGTFDPRDIELRTRSFETDELIKRQYQKR